MLSPFKQNCADRGYNSNPFCHPDYRTPVQKKVMGAAYARRKNSWWFKCWNYLHHKFSHCCTNTILLPANVVGGADKSANARPTVQVDHVDD
eukprot:15204989-Ditylum_brightwellii.AAC.1